MAEQLKNAEQTKKVTPNEGVAELSEEVKKEIAELFPNYQEA